MEFIHSSKEGASSSADQPQDSLSQEQRDATHEGILRLLEYVRNMPPPTKEQIQEFHRCIEENERQFELRAERQRQHLSSPEFLNFRYTL